MKTIDFGAVGTYFRQQRQRASVSQRDLAVHLGYSSSQMISNWERGVCAPPLDAILQMVRLFKIPQNEVMEVILKENRKFLSKMLRSGTKRPVARRA